MIIVRVELHSEVTGEVTEIARMHVYNAGRTKTHNKYEGKTFWGKTKEDLDEQIKIRAGVVRNYRGPTLHVWHLVTEMLRNMGYSL